MKSIFHIFITSFIIISLFSIFFVQTFSVMKDLESLPMENEEIGLNQEDSEELDFEEIEEVIQTSGLATEEPKINSKAAIVWDRNTKQVLYEKNPDKKVPMASTTKIMTAIVVVENIKLTEEVTIEKKAAQTGRIASRIENKR